MLAKMNYDLPLLLFRISFGGAMLTHGLPKLMGYSEMMNQFPDPFMIGSALSLALVVFAEVGCSLAIITGFCTRLASIPLVITMLTAFIMIHGNDPFAKKELDFLYLTGFAVIGLMGAGKWSLDYMINKIFNGKTPKIFRMNLSMEYKI